MALPTFYRCNCSRVHRGRDFLHMVAKHMTTAYVFEFEDPVKRTLYMSYIAAVIESMMGEADEDNVVHVLFDTMHEGFCPHTLSYPGLIRCILTTDVMFKKAWGAEALERRFRGYSPLVRRKLKEWLKMDDVTTPLVLYRPGVISFSI